MTISEELRRFVIDNFFFGNSNRSLSDTDSFLQMGIIDSTGVLELVAFLEGKYAIKVADPELVPENLDSITGLTRFVEARLQRVPPIATS